jgi:hypothetical protein
VGQVSLNELIQVATDSAMRAFEARKFDPKLGFPRIWVGIWVDLAGQAGEFFGTRGMERPQ